MRSLTYIFLILVALLLRIQVRAQEYNVRIINEEKVPKDILKQYNNIKGDSAGIHSRLALFMSGLHAHGYVAAAFDSIKIDSTRAYAYLHMGEKYIWGKLDWQQLEPDLLDYLKLKRKDFEVVNPERLIKLKSNIISFYENSGYPFASAKLNHLEIQDSVFKAVITDEKGDYFSVDSLIVKGDVKISHNYLKKVLQIEPGMPFNQERINEINKKITDLSFLSEIKPAEIEFSEESVDLYLYLQKRKANMFNGIIGFSPESDNKQAENTGKLVVTGDLKLELVNSIGRGEEVYLHWEKLESTTQKLDLGFMYPYLFKTNLGIDADFELYKKDSTYLSLKAGLGLRLFLSDNDYVKAYYRYKSSSRIGDEQVFASSINNADIKSNIIGVSYYLSELDYRYNPKKGVEINFFAGAGFKKIIDAQNAVDSLKITIDDKTLEVESGLNLDIYFPIYKNFIFHFSNATRYLDQFSEKDKETILFENELYRFGGANTLRGFDESIFYASVYSAQNIEIRYLFEKNSAFYAFWNGAYYYKNVSQAVTEDFPWGFGIGLDFDTRAGIFSLSYALGKQFDNPFEIQTAKIHFGYISRF